MDIKHGWNLISDTKLNKYLGGDLKPYHVESIESFTIIQYKIHHKTVNYSLGGYLDLGHVELIERFTIIQYKIQYQTAIFVILLPL